MKILFLCYEHPAPEIAGSHRVLYSLEHLAGKHGHQVTLAAFKLRGKSYPDLSQHARVETVELARRPGFGAPGVILKSIPRILNMSSGLPAFTRYGYSSEMDTRVNALLHGAGYDIIAVDHPAMLGYVLDKGIPVVLLEAFAPAEISHLEYRLEKNPLKKILRYVYHRQTRGYARLYHRVNLLIAVSSHQRDMVRAHDSSLNFVVIPYGVDDGFFEADDMEAESPTLIITGSMSGPRNTAAVMEFYREIYSLIKERIPRIQLQVVGSNPDTEIKALAEDASVTVTGYVPDLRPYLRRAWVVAAPLQEGFGVKVRILQAMATGRPVVATPPVTTGIDVSPEENIIIAERPAEFADRVIALLNDKRLRERIGVAARHLMVTEHSWAKLADRLNEVLERTAAQNLSS